MKERKEEYHQTEEGRNKLEVFDEQCIGRISEVQKNSYLIRYWEKEIPAKLSGKFYRKETMFPVVGDYVTFRYNPKGDSKIIEICERKNFLTRPDTAKSMKEQLKEMLPQIKVYAVSALTGDGMDKLQVYLQPGNTIALLGSSGVGKSTLVNALAGTEIMKTGEIREKDAKGRHTTTYREMIELPNNVVIIDTPGMREIGLCDVDEGIDDTFEDIAELAAQCRFRDCTHTNEPRCAVRQALENGQLSKERFELYRSLHVESRKSADMKAIAKARKALNKTRKR